MLKKERHDHIMRHINLHNRVLTSDLVNLLNVSEDTIRRDLQELSDEKHLIKVHGGALSKSYHSTFDDSSVYAKDRKISIAQKAITLIKDGMVVLTGGGTTIIEVVKHLPENLHATFFTLSPLVAVELARFPNVEVIMLGGSFSKNSQIVYGGQAINQISELNIDLCLMGTSAIHPINGLTDTDWEINQLKKTMIAASHKVAVMCIAEKLDIALRLKVCALENIDFLITDLDPDDDALHKYRVREVKVL